MFAYGHSGSCVFFIRAWIINLTCDKRPPVTRHPNCRLTPNQATPISPPLVRAERAGFAVAEIPVVVRELRPSRTSILRRVPRTVGGIIRLRRVLGRPPKR